MAHVVDCSAIMGLCFEDEFNDFHNRLLDQLQADVAFAPSIWPAEVANVLLVAERRKRIAPADAADFLRLLSALNIQVADDEGLVDAHIIMPLARESGLSYYDAQYLHLARVTGHPLATLDQALRKAAKKAGVATMS